MIRTKPRIDGLESREALRQQDSQRDQCRGERDLDTDQPSTGRPARGSSRSRPFAKVRTQRAGRKAPRRESGERQRGYRRGAASEKDHAQVDGGVVGDGQEIARRENEQRSPCDRTQKQSARTSGDRDRAALDQNLANEPRT